MAKEEVREWHWRNSMKVVRFFGIDARAAAFWIFVLLHFRTWTFVLAAIVTIVFLMLERRGLTYKAAWRAARVWFIGNKRPALIWTTRRKMLDIDG